MIPRDKVRMEALSLATEDYFGLYELIWGLNARFPDASIDEKLNAAQAALAELLSQGLVEVYFARSSPSEYIPLDPKRAPTLIADPDSWRSPSQVLDGTFYAFCATPAGERAYFSLSPEDLSDP
jgi:hypothetical protein